MTCGIYKITNLENNKCYIGLSNNIEKRWKEHISNAYNCDDINFNNPLYQDIKKYKVDSFIFEILEECEQNLLSEKEKYYIEKYNSFIPNGYNRTLGGRGKAKPTVFICKNCGKPLKRFSKTRVGLCLDCYKLSICSHIPSREILKEKIRNTTFNDIAREYNLKSGNTIKKWCKKLNLPFLKSEINNYTDEEWELI